MEEKDQAQQLKELVKNSKLALIEALEEIENPVEKHNLLIAESENVRNIILSHERILNFIASMEKSLLAESPELSTTIRIQKALQNGLGIYNLAGAISFDSASPCFDASKKIFTPIELPLVKNELDTFLNFHKELLTKKIKSYEVITDIDLYGWSQEND